MSELNIANCPFCGGEAVSKDGKLARCAKGEIGNPDVCAGAVIRIPINIWNRRSTTSGLVPLDREDIKDILIQVRMEKIAVYEGVNAICAKFGSLPPVSEEDLKELISQCQYRKNVSPNNYEMYRKEAVDNFMQKFGTPASVSVEGWAGIIKKVTEDNSIHIRGNIDDIKYFKAVAEAIHAKLNGDKEGKDS